MTLNEYQEKAMETCMPSSNNFSYMMLNLVGEVGEFASKVAKHIRKGTGYIDFEKFLIYRDLSDDDPLCKQFEEICEKYGDDSDAATAFYKRIEEEEELRYNKYVAELKKEAGDIAWQLAGLCKVMGWSLEEVCQMNLDKLASRKKRGVIDGNGDNR